MIFTVLVPTYNQAQYLGAALDSLLAQTIFDWEAIIINDGSTDSTPEVIHAYCQKDKRFKALHKQNGGVGSALNEGLVLAQGEWVCWLSSDNLFDSRKLEIHTEWITRQPDCNFFFSHFRILEESTGQITNPPLRQPVPDKEFQILEMLVTPYINGNSICVNRKAWQNVGIFSKKLHYGQDYDMWLRLLSTCPATFIPEPTCITRRHPEQTTHVFPKDGFYDYARAAINFLNQHTFTELFPLLDLADPQSAQLAVKKALDVAANRDAFLQMLGPNPALLFRILEWAWHILPSQIAGPIKKMIINRSAKVSREYQNTLFGFYWKLVNVACQLPDGKFEYLPISPISVAEMNLWQLFATKHPDVTSIHRYLEERFEGQCWHDAVTVSSRKSKEIVFVCQRGAYLADPVKYGTYRATIEQAKYLMRAGYLVLLTGLSEHKIDFIEGVLAIGAPDNKTLYKIIKMLGPIDTLIGISRADMIQMAYARRVLVYHHGPHPIERADLLQSIMGKTLVPVVCVSNHSREEQISYGVSENQTHIVPNAYDASIYTAPIYDKERHLHSLVFVGHIMPYKGVDIAIQAFTLIKKHFPNASLHIYGKNCSWSESNEHLFHPEWLDDKGFPYWSAIKRDVPGLYYEGEVLPTKLVEAYQRYSLLIMPSRVAETFGIVSLEAQACGCIPVLPRKGGFPETLQNGKTGYLYEQNTATGLANKILEIWENNLPVQKQRKEAYKWVQTAFSWERSGESFLQIIETTPTKRCDGISVVPYYLSLWWRQLLFNIQLVPKGITLFRNTVKGKPVNQWSVLLKQAWMKYRAR